MATTEKAEKKPRKRITIAALQEVIAGLEVENKRLAGQIDKDLRSLEPNKDIEISSFKVNQTKMQNDIYYLKKEVASLTKIAMYENQQRHSDKMYSHKDLDDHRIVFFTC